MMLVKEVQIFQGKFSARIDIFFLQLTGLQSIIDYCEQKQITDDVMVKDCTLAELPVHLSKLPRSEEHYTGKISFILLEGHNRIH